MALWCPRSAWTNESAGEAESRVSTGGGDWNLEEAWKLEDLCFWRLVGLGVLGVWSRERGLVVASV